MFLLPPRVRGPLSECSTRVRVDGQLAGADVEVVVVGSGAVVASGTSTTGSLVLPLTGSLSAGDEVAARQRLGSDASELTPERVMVQRKPDAIGPVAFVSKLFECGRCLWLEGAVPGADVEVRDGATTLGSANSYDGIARVGLGTPLQASMDVVGQQNACGEDGALTDAPPVESLGRDQGRTLSPPTVREPLKGCQNRVTVADVYHGATVTLLRSGGPDLTACFDRGSLWFRVTPPLVEGESISARQAFPDCEIFSPDADPVPVGPLEPVTRPDILEPLCAGATSVTLSGLHAGAHVRIMVVGAGHHGGDAPPAGGTPYEGTAPEDGTFSFPIPPLPPGSAVYAQQALCGIWSAPSDGAMVHDAPESLTTPRIPEPVFECATRVRVEDVTPGTRVYVFSEALGAPIGEAAAFAEEVDVRVAPMLQAEDRIFAQVIGCGLSSDTSLPVDVRHLEQLGAPTIVRPVYACYDAVTVEDVVPGAIVDVYVNGVWAGTTVAAASPVHVGIEIGDLEAGQEVRARQRLCGRVSELSRPARVEDFPGRWIQVGGDKKAEILAVHAALLPSGQILYFGGDQHDSGAAAPNTPDVDHTRLFDCTTHQIRAITGLPASADLFCAGHALLEDGTLVTGGGTERWAFARAGDHLHRGHFPGTRESWRFRWEPVGSESWERVGQLVTARPDTLPDGTDIDETGGRWYPTLTTLPNGQVVAIGGHPLPEDPRHTNSSLELYTPSSKSWDFVGSTDYDNIPGTAEVPGRLRHSEYPRMHVLPEGTLFVVSTMQDRTVEKWTPYSDPQDWEFVADQPPAGGGPWATLDLYRDNPQPSTSVLLPLHHDQDFHARVLLAGAETAYVIAPQSASPTWSATTRTMMDYPSPGTHNPNRIYLNATLLPSGEVFVSGGTHDSEDATGVRRGEMFDPESDTWSVLPEAATVRNYHSVALLMPDGSVWHAGSNINGSSGGEEVRNLTVEIFQPWYFCERRPRITSASSRVCRGDRLFIRTPDAHRIRRVALVRFGSVTHAFNPDQRYVSIPFEQGEESDLLEATVPARPAVMIPGYYLLFILADGRVPSKGIPVQICRSSGTRPGYVLPEWFPELVDWVIRRFPTDSPLGKELILRTVEVLDHVQHEDDGEEDSDAVKEILHLLRSHDHRLDAVERRLRKLRNAAKKRKGKKGKKGD